MIHPLQLPRTLRGAGGIRLINMPGVRYPDEVLQGPSGTGASRTSPLRKAPPGFISSQNAAELLGITPRSARAMLARRNTRRVMVREPGKAACVYWERLKVQELLETRCPLVRNLPARFCDSAEACYILMIARSTLHRYVKQGALKEYQVRRAFAGGVHREAYYLRAEVRKLEPCAMPPVPALKPHAGNASPGCGKTTSLANPPAYQEKISETGLIDANG